MLLLSAAGTVSCSDEDNGRDTPEPELPVSSASRTIFDVAVDYAIEAADKNGIEADLDASRPLPEGAQYGITFRRLGGGLPSTLTLELVTEKDTAYIGSIRSKNTEGVESLPEAYQLLLPDKPVSGCLKWELVTESGLLLYDVLIYLPKPEGDIGAFYLYEDLTGKYQKMFPDACVTAVVRRQTLSH